MMPGKVTENKNFNPKIHSKEKFLSFLSLNDEWIDTQNFIILKFSGNLIKTLFGGSLGVNGPPAPLKSCTYNRSTVE